jgi:DNA-binding NtrC family response regulator
LTFFEPFSRQLNTPYVFHLVVRRLRTSPNRTRVRSLGWDCFSFEAKQRVVMSRQDEKLWLEKDLFGRPENLGEFEVEKKPTILIVERDDTLRRSLKEELLRRGFVISESSDKADILRNFPNPGVRLIIIGSLENGSWEGLKLAREIRRLDRNFPIILIAAETSEELAIAALRAGINDYFKQPYSVEDLVSSVERHFPGSPLRLAQQTAKAPASDIIYAHRMIGESVAMQEIRAAIGRIALTDSNVLITGETGTGKELVAELIHANSRRAHRAFVCINCAAIPDSLLESELFGYERGSFTGAYSSSKGKLKSGDGGTIFLDEIGDMSPYAQAKILRVIESRELQRLGGRENIPLNVRFIAATNKDLEQAVAEKTFRKDLYYRLNVASIQLPLLKDRKEDIPSLCDHYIRDFNRQFGRRVEAFAEETAEALIRYDWPGNVRELKNLLEATVGNFRCTQKRSVTESCGQCPEVSFRCRQISFSDLPEQFRRGVRNTENLPPDERHPLLSALISTNWNISKAAQKLRWSRMTIYRKMAKYHIHRKESGAIDAREGTSHRNTEIPFPPQPTRFQR